MSLEVNLRTRPLTDAVAATIQRTLDTRCIPPAAGRYLDHIEVLRDRLSVSPGRDGVALAIPAHVYAVTEGELAAHCNATPPGALNPAGGLGFRFAIRGLGRRVESGPEVQLAELSPEDLPGMPLPPPIRDLVAGAQRSESMPLSDVFDALHLPPPTVADAVVVGDTVAVRFGTTAAPASRLTPASDWGIFLGVDSLEDLVHELLRPALASTSGAAIESISWIPAAGPSLVARVGVTYQLTLPTPLGKLTHSTHAWIDFRCALALIPRAGGGVPPQLRLSCSWSAHIVIDGAPALVEELFEAEATRQLRRLFNPARIGAQPTGERSFTVDWALVEPALFGVQTRITLLTSSPEGLLLGGHLAIPTVVSAPLGMEPGELSPPLRIQLCSELARAGSGAPKGLQTVENSRCMATVRLRGIGALCSWRILPPNDGLLGAYFSAAVADDEVGITASMPYSSALEASEPLRVMVQTARGVRMFDLGTAPQPELGPDGSVVGGWDWYLPNCLHFDDRWPGRLGSGLDDEQRWGVDRFRPVPLEGPDWATYAGSALGGLTVHMVSVRGLEPGELVQARTATHAVDVTADARGRATVPVIAPLEISTTPVLVTRASGAAFASQPEVRTAGLVRSGRVPSESGTVPPRIIRQLTRSMRGSARQRLVGLLDGTARASEENSLNPQPLPPHPDELGRTLGLELREVVPIPGFEGDPMAVATTAAGDQLLIDLTAGARVSGTFLGPIGRLEHGAGWALARGSGTPTLLEVAGAGQR